MVGGSKHLSALNRLEVYGCGVTSSQPLPHFKEELQKLPVLTCKEMPGLWWNAIAMC
jgi:hypothetical protein